MQRIYINGWRDKEPTGIKTPVEVSFTFKAEEAHAWPSEEQANRLCPVFDSYDVKVDWTEDGEQFICKFKVEELTPRAFVLFCEGPFISKANGCKGVAS